MTEQVTKPPVVRGRWHPMTWEEFLDWAPDEGKAEWVDGWGIALVSNATRHVLTVDFLAALLGAYLRMSGLGRLFTQQMLLRLPSRPAGRMPDVMVVLNAHGDLIGERWIEGAADLVIEVLSESTDEIDLIEKRREYEQAGIPEYIMIDVRPGRERVIYLRLGPDGEYDDVLADAAGRYHSEVVAGFWFHPDWLWPSSALDVEDCLIEIAPDAYEAWMQAKFRARRAASNQS